MNSPRKRVGRARRDKVLEQFGHKCFYCGDPATVVDHVVPYAYSQDNSEKNLVAACVRCNAIVGSMVFDSLMEKASYIHEVRSRSKKGIAVPTCCDCGEEFWPGRDGASNLLCGRCYKKASE